MELFNLVNNVPISTLYGASVDDLRRDYPFLKEDDVRAALLYAAKRIANEEVYEA